MQETCTWLGWRGVNSTNIGEKEEEEKTEETNFTNLEQFFKLKLKSSYKIENILKLNMFFRRQNKQQFQFLPISFFCLKCGPFCHKT